MEDMPRKENICAEKFADWTLALKMSFPAVVTNERIDTDANGKTYLRAKLIDDLETEVEPETRLVRVECCPMYNKMKVRFDIQNENLSKLSFCCSMICLANYH